MSFGDKFGKFKQWSLQSVGRADKTQEDEEFQEMIKIMKETKIELNNLLDACKKFHRQQTDAAESLEKVSGALSKVTSPETSARGNMLEAVPLTSKTSSASIEFLNAFKVNIIDVLVNIIEINQKTCERQWKLVEDARLAYDAATAKFKSLLETSKKATQEDIDRAKQKADDSEAAYNKAKESCAEACAELAKQKDQFAIEKIPTLANYIGEQGATMCGAAQSCLEAISK